MDIQNTKTHTMLDARIFDQTRVVHQNGFTLIEVLVAMLILAVGLLGVAALQFKGLKYSTDAAIRSNISVFAYDIADKIRLNRANAQDYAPLNYTVPATRPTGGCTQGNGSDKDNDLNCWYQSFWIDDNSTTDNSSLVPPGTAVSIIRTGSAGTAAEIYTVGFAWTDRESTTHTINYGFKP